MSNRLKTLAPIAALAALAAPAVYAGCLAPSDAVVDGANAIGVFWGNSHGELLYVLFSEKRLNSGDIQEWVRLRQQPPAGASIMLEARPTYSARKKVLVSRRVGLPDALFGDGAGEDTR